MIWRFRAAPVDRRILCYEQLESLWPVNGNVMVREGIAHFVAGRSAFVDGGLCLFRVNVASGEVVSETPMDNRNPETGKDQTLFIAGPRDVLDESGLGKKLEGKEVAVAKQEAAYLGKSGGVLWAVSAADGQKKAEHLLDSPPVFDGMAAAHGKLYVVTMDGKVCLTGK